MSRTRWGAAALLLVGGVAGVLFWGGFHTALEVTNTMDFCISCHSYAAVKVDCFECHSSKRQTVGFAPLDHLQSTTPVLARLTAQCRRLTEGGR